MKTETTEAAPLATTPVARTEGGQFAKGAVANPAGRPKGKKHQLTSLQQDLEIAVRQSLSVERIKRIVDKVCEMAEAGNPRAQKLILDKIVSNASNTQEDASEAGRTVVFRIENATFAAQTKTQTPIDVEVIDVTPTKVIEHGS